MLNRSSRIVGLNFIQITFFDKQGGEMFYAQSVGLAKKHFYIHLTPSPLLTNKGTCRKPQKEP